MMFGGDNDYRWPMMGNYSAAQSTWTRFEDKVFEHALLIFPDEMVDRWQMIAQRLPGKSPEEVRAHYEVLVHDVFEIESGRVKLPIYADDTALACEPESSQISFGSTGRNEHGEGERKKGTPWTEEEHRLFLIGLDTYGKGDWRCIARNVVATRTLTQVASHAQKFFLCQNLVKKDRKRSKASMTSSPPSMPNRFLRHLIFLLKKALMGYGNFNYPM